MKRGHVASLAGLFLTLACGSAPSQAESDPELGTSHAALCAGAPEVHGDYVTLRGCPFEQQVSNILEYGDTISPQQLLDAAGERVATVTASCDSWWLGEDVNGVAVLLDSDTGSVLSHGAIHPGLAISDLPTELAFPFSLEAH